MSKNCAQITEFFQLKKKSEKIPGPVVKNTNVSEKFYAKFLIEQTNQGKCDENCESRKMELKNRLHHEKSKLLSIEKALETCMFMIGIKDEKIDRILKKK